LAPEQHAQLQRHHHVVQAQSEPKVPQSQPGEAQGTRHRRRRGRRGRGRRGSGFPHGQQSFAPQHQERVETAALEHAPNAPSQPEWSFESMPRETKSPEGTARAQPEHRDTSVDPTPKSAESQPETPGQRRKGWWQRNFKIGAD
jgi:hypothetical protein